jgi:LuxR family quorum sensing-dependent transcriptional regulator
MKPTRTRTPGATDPQAADAARRARAARDFIETATEIADLDELKRRFAEVAGLYGFHRSACVQIATPGCPVAPKMLFTHGAEEWGKRYLAEELQRNDPTIQAIFAADRPFTWTEVRARTRDARGMRVFEEADKTGGREALVIPIHGALGEVSAMILVTDTRRIEAADRPTLHLLGTVYATVGRTLTRPGGEEPAASPLTRREGECLAWVARGKTDWAIGQILGISERTVESHINSARIKVGADTRAHAIMEAWRRGWLVHPID